MASKVNQSSGVRHDRPNGGIAISAADRSRDFRNARRHTLLVSTLRYALPVATLVMAGYFGLTVLQRSGWGVSVPSIPIPKILPENLTMNNPRYEGFTPDGDRFEVTALTAKQEFTSTDLVRLDTISGILNDKAGVRTDLKAGSGLFNTKSNQLDLGGSVDIVSTSGMKARLSSATVLMKESIITSIEPVIVEMTAGSIRANEMKLRHKLREVTFLGGVETHLQSANRSKATAVAPAKAPPASPFGSSDAPIDISSSRLDINDTTKLAVFTGAVRAVQDGATLTSPELQVSYSGQATGLPSGAGPAPDTVEQTGKVKRIVASGPVDISQTTGERLTSSSATFDAETGRAYLDGNVVMTQLPDRRAVSDRAELDQRAETVVLVGNVLLGQGRNEIKGHRLTSDRSTGRTRVTSPKEDGGDGRIAARFYRTVQPGAAAVPTPATAAGGFGAMSFNTDPSAPVDINAESLDINDQRKAAVFVGDVLAVQGGFQLRTAELTAIYSGEAGLGGGAAAKDTTAKAGAELQRIEARKAVVVQSQDGQTATGDWANFDTKRNLVVVGGDVVLTQGPNVIRGSRLNIDMTTGRSTIETEPSSGWSARAQPSGDGSAGGAKAAIDVPSLSARTRPSAVFYPKNLKERSNAAKADKPAQGKNAEAWGPVTRPTPERGD